MLSQLSTIPLWLHLLGVLLVVETITSRLMVKPSTVDYGNRTAPPQQVQDNISKFMWVLTCCYVLVIGAFWLGHNWARILVLIASTLSFFNALLSVKVSTKTAKAYMVFDTVFSGMVMIWLLQPGVTVYFTAAK